MNKKELLSYIGDISQIGGIRDFTFNDGKRKGVRAIEINTGNFCFTVLPDRCLDIAQAFYKGTAISWISKSGITASGYYDKDGKNFLRSFFGGLVTTCGLKNIGRPYKEQGLHGRIANIPAENVSVFADWINDEYVMKITGQMRESMALGENLVMKRTITAKMFSDEFVLEDTVINEGFSDEKIALCYHCNFGYPMINEHSRILNVPEEVSMIEAPQSGADEKCIPVMYDNDFVTVGIDNGKIISEISYKTDTLPDFLIWKMLKKGDYVVALEPRTTRFGGENIEKNDKYIILKPFEELKTYLKFSVRKSG